MQIQARKRVLIIDDERDTCEILESKLTEAGCTVSCAHDGAEGLEKIVSEQPDLVILDILMPGTSGLDLLRAYGEQAAPGGPHFIVVTNMDAMQAMSSVFSHTVTDVRSKSDTTVEQIVALVQKRLGMHVANITN